MKYVWAVLVCSLVAGVYFTPGPDVGQSSLDYIVNGRETWQAGLCSVIASICGSILIMAGLSKSEERDRIDWFCEKESKANERD